MHDGQWIAGKAPVGEHVEDVELKLHRRLLPACEVARTLPQSQAASKLPAAVPG